MSTGQSVIVPSFLFVPVFKLGTAVKRLAFLLISVVPSPFIKISYLSVGVIKVSDPLDELSLNDSGPWFDGVRVSDSELISIHVGLHGLFPGVVTPLELGTYEWSTRMIFPTV